MNLRVELVHLNSSGFQIYKFNINLFYKSNSEVEAAKYIACENAPQLQNLGVALREEEGRDFFP